MKPFLIWIRELLESARTMKKEEVCENSLVVAFLFSCFAIFALLLYLLSFFLLQMSNVSIVCFAIFSLFFFSSHSSVQI
jgi:hypothetical protein